MRYSRKKLVTGIVCLVVLVSVVFEVSNGNLEEQDPLLAYLISSGDITEEMVCYVSLLRFSRW